MVRSHKRGTESRWVSSFMTNIVNRKSLSSFFDRVGRLVETVAWWCNPLLCTWCSCTSPPLRVQCRLSVFSFSYPQKAAGAVRLLSFWLAFHPQTIGRVDDKDDIALRSAQSSQWSLEGDHGGVRPWSSPRSNIADRAWGQSSPASFWPMLTHTHTHIAPANCAIDD